PGGGHTGRGRDQLRGPKPDLPRTGRSGQPLCTPAVRLRGRPGPSVPAAALHTCPGRPRSRTAGVHSGWPLRPVRGRSGFGP
ncbi:hypothetical protein C6A85_15020, partial [Mycobacterium sp. ITM-2017-0098]